MRHHLFRRWQKAQSLVEFSLILPIIMTMTLSIAEFGMAYGTNMTMIEATREGARVGAVLVNGSNSLGMTGITGAACVDAQIILAVQRVVQSPGSGITLANIDNIHIFKANASGGEALANVWTVGASTRCTLSLAFTEGSVGWNATARNATLPVDAIGVSIQYRYRLFTPLSAITGLFGLNTITMRDSTVMDLEP
jgi:hypothetical protein